MDDIQKLAHALLCAARAFAACYQTSENKIDSQVAEKPKGRVTETSNGIPVCEKHGKAHRPSKSGNGYYCLDCFLERKNARN